MTEKTNLNPATDQEIKVRWLLTAERPRLLDIERMAVPEAPWRQADLERALRPRESIPFVAVMPDGVVAGYMIYWSTGAGRCFNINRIAVHPAYQRRGIGRLLITTLKNKIVQQGRDALTIQVPDSYLGLQLFLRAEGFVASATEVFLDPDLTEHRMLSFRFLREWSK